MSKPTWINSYRKLSRIKLLCPHSITTPDGKKRIVDLDALKRVRDKMNERAKRGQLATLSEDHIITIDDTGKPVSKSSADIKLLGFGLDYTIDQDEHGTPWLMGTAYNTPGKEKDIEELPFTSVEYMPNEDVIANIAFTKHKPVMDNGTITPYHWKRGTVSDTGKATFPLVAYSNETQAGEVLIYSVESPRMNPLQIFIASMKQNLETLEKSVESEGTEGTPATPAAKPAKVLSYAGLSGSATMTPEEENRQFRRRFQLEALAKTKKLDVDVELEQWKGHSEEAFNTHCEAITHCYASINAGGAKVNPLGNDAGTPTDAQLLPKARDILVKVAGRGEHSNLAAVMDKLRANPTWNGD